MALKMRRLAAVMDQPMAATEGLPEPVRNKLTLLKKWLQDRGSVLVAYSGGIDSTFLAFMAKQSLGPNSMLACTAYSEIYPDHETREAERIAQQLEFPFEMIRSHELDNPKFAENSPIRCYHCKQELFSRLLGLAEAKKLACVVDGQNLDDEGDFRPGRRAARELNIESPLALLGFNKSDIRTAAQAHGLPNWDKPPHPCLSTRFPFGKRISSGRLKIVESVEDFLRGLGLGQMRLRVHDDSARIEVPVEDFEVIMQPEVRSAIVERLLQEGFRYVTLDLEGLISGKMNRSLKEEQRVKTPS